MFRALYRSSSGALSLFAVSGLHKHVVTGRSKPEAANTFRAPDDMRNAARNMLSL
jgi:hypothetical protein